MTKRKERKQSKHLKSDCETAHNKALMPAAGDGVVIKFCFLNFVRLVGQGAAQKTAAVISASRWRSWLKKDENTYDNIILVNVDFLRTRE